ncbi:MAG: hypothetical protein ACM34K_01310, partial [Bacillota bacterium]
MNYIIKEPDFCGGFIYKSIENLHIVTRDNEGNLLSSEPINLIRKGLRTEKGEIIDFTADKVILNNGKEEVSANRFLLNAYLMKKALESEIQPEYIQTFYKSIGKPFKEEEHPRDREGKFTKKNENRQKVEGDFIPNLYKEFCENVVGTYNTPIGRIQVRQEDFHKILRIEGISKKVFVSFINEKGEQAWKELTYEKDSIAVIGELKELLKNPDRISINNQPSIEADFIFSKKYKNTSLSVAFTIDDIIKTARILREDYIEKHAGEIIYEKKKGLLKKSIDLKNLQSFAKCAVTGSRQLNLTISEIFVKQNEHKLFKAFGNFFKMKNFSTTPAPAKEAPAATSNAWNKKGGEKPGHKYIQRKPNSKGDGYIYLYELPNGKQQWQDDKGEVVSNPDKVHKDYSDFKTGDYINYEGKDGKIIDSSDNLFVIQFSDKQLVVNKNAHLEKLHRDINLRIGDPVMVNDLQGKVKEVGSKIALIETEKGNYLYKLSSPILRKERAQGIEDEKTKTKKIMEGDPTGDSDKLKHNYESSLKYQFWKDVTEGNGYIRRNDLRYEKHVKSPFGQLKVTQTFDPEKNSESININGTDNPTIFFNKNNYSIKNVSEDGMWLQNDEGQEFYYFEDMEKHLDKKINLIQKQEEKDPEKRSIRFTWDKSGKVAAEYQTREQAEASANDPERKLQAIKEAVKEKAQNDGSRWKRIKEVGPTQTDEERARVEQENEENKKKIKEVLTSKDFSSYASDMQERGFKFGANPLIGTKEVQFNNQKYKLRTEFNWRTGEHETRIFDGPFKQLQLGNEKYDIYDISDGVITYTDKNGLHRQVTRDELESINGKSLFTPTGSFKGKIGKISKIIMPDNTSRNSNYALMELDDIIASHNEKTFLPSESYPQEDGKSVNDRDYEHDENAQAFVRTIAQNWDSRTINSSKEAGQNIIVSKEGHVLSGNNRTMSAKLAAEQYPEKWQQYQQDLKNEISDFGFSPEDLEGMKNPILVKIDHDIPKLSKAELGKYNLDTTKGKDFVQKGMQYGDILKKNPHIMNGLISIVNGVENFSDIYRSASNQAEVMKFFTESGIVLPQKLPDYFDQKSGTLTDQGKELFETVMISSVLDQNALSVSNSDGVRSVTNNIKESISSLSKNMALQNGYSLKPQINNAVNLQSRYARTSEQKGIDFDTFLSQIDMFDNPPTAQDVAINLLSKKGPRILNTAIKAYNSSAEVEQEGGGMFGDAATPDDVFQNKILNGKNPFSGQDYFTDQEKEIISRFSSVSKKETLATSIKNTLIKAFNKVFRKTISIDSPKLDEGAKVESEHEDLYNELKRRLEDDGSEMPMSREAFFKFIARQHIEENPDYYELLKRFVENKTEKSIKLFNIEFFPVIKSINTSNNQLLPSKINPTIRRWQNVQQNDNLQDKNKENSMEHNENKIKEPWEMTREEYGTSVDEDRIYVAR